MVKKLKKIYANITPKKLFIFNRLVKRVSASAMVTIYYFIDKEVYSCLSN